MIPWLASDAPFPPLEQALQEPNGLLAASAELDGRRLLQAYQRGIFPWFNPGEPVLWWSPDPRMVLYPEELKISRSLRQRMRRQDHEIRYNTAFERVIAACASTSRPGQHGTWIDQQIIRGYSELHARGYAHSAETWMDGALVGGLYGVSIGKVFYGESMFHHVSDASKLAFVHLVQALQQAGCALIDCQMHTAHLHRFGARPIPRTLFARQLSELVDCYVDYPFFNRNPTPGS
ncbi:leucyl/phenylalanyl-tRNA--protein transferase [Methylobacillus flagellatus]|uniref:leucyl/phenylalanyl-tRNA--protein transferase n=1 Tax=Methylobacillus flagellatus TaxID=405 RepID=UPI0010F934FC|nr:leucyl/phenylalanyl-tRNA--protein transferase [Methylobacillus flagellatus]